MNVFETINKVMEEIGYIGKDKSTTGGQRYNYRGVDDVMNALNPAMVKHKLFIVPEILEQIREDRITTNGGKVIYSICKIKYTFFAVDGTSVSAVVIGESFDSGDKATNKAMSVAFKYACFQVFCIPTEEMKDPDAEVHELAGTKNDKKADKSKEPNKAKEEPKQAGQNVNRLELIKSFEDEIKRTGKPKAWFFEQAKVTSSNFISNELLIKYIDALKQYPNKGEKNEQQEH